MDFFIKIFEQIHFDSYINFFNYGRALVEVKSNPSQIFSWIVSSIDSNFLDKLNRLFKLEGTKKLTK